MSGAAEQEALAFVAALFPQTRQLCLALDAFGDDGDAEARSEAEDRANDRLRIPVAAEIAHERAIDLDLGKSKALASWAGGR